MYCLFKTWFWSKHRFFFESIYVSPRIFFFKPIETSPSVSDVTICGWGATNSHVCMKVRIVAVCAWSLWTKICCIMKLWCVSSHPEPHNSHFLLPNIWWRTNYYLFLRRRIDAGKARAGQRVHHKHKCGWFEHRRCLTHYWVSC